jgi:hypothetical protein
MERRLHYLYFVGCRWLQYSGVIQKQAILLDDSYHGGEPVTVVFKLGYAKTCYGAYKIGKGGKKYFVTNIEGTGPYSGVATGDPDVRTFN